jgi:probable phosphoglycerate mutase
VPVITDTGLRERCFGRFEGRTFADVEATDPASARRWRQRDPAFEPPGGESLDAFFARVLGAARRLCAAHPDAQVALVAHGGVLDCLYRAATGVALEAPRTWPVPNAAVNRLLVTGEGLSLVAWGDARHLEGETARDELGPVA